MSTLRVVDLAPWTPMYATANTVSCELKVRQIPVLPTLSNHPAYGGCSTFR